VRFDGNGYTTRETVQTYWLYKCAQLALEQGFTGFEILSDIRFVMRPLMPDDETSHPPGALAAAIGPIPASPNEVANLPAARPERKNVVLDEAAEYVRVASATPIIIYEGGGPPKPSIEGDVPFLTQPIESKPPKLFNAKALMAKLDPIVKADKCDFGNICPHVHAYLLPNGKLQ
jgi:hypothetical protein